MSALSDMPTVLTVEETARVLRIGRSAAYAAVRAGELPAIRVGRCLRVPRCRLAAMLGEPENDQERRADALGGKAGHGPSRDPE